MVDQGKRRRRGSNEVAKYSLVAGMVGGLIAYVLLAPFRCTLRPALPASEEYYKRCSGLIAHDYSVGVSESPSHWQAVLTSILVGAIIAVVLWALLRRPQLHGGVALFAAGALVALTLTFLSSLGGAMAVAAPVLVPVLWLSAKQSRGWMKGVWIVLTGLSTLQATWIYVFLVTENADYALPIALACGSAAVYFFLSTTRSIDAEA